MRGGQRRPRLSMLAPVAGDWLTMTRHLGSFCYLIIASFLMTTVCIRIYFYAALFLENKKKNLP